MNKKAACNDAAQEDCDKWKQGRNILRSECHYDFSFRDRKLTQSLSNPTGVPSASNESAIFPRSDVNVMLVPEVNRYVLKSRQFQVSAHFSDRTGCHET